MRLWSTLLFATFLTLGLSSPAEATSPPLEYTAHVDGTTVTICPSGSEEKSCPAAGGMLREDVETGEVVRLADHCVYGGEGWESECYVDECVPPGTYRYGFAEPYACSPFAAWVHYYTTATVETPLGDCTRGEANEAPTPTDGVPWGNSNDVCEGEGLGGCTCIGGSAVPQGMPIAPLVGLVLGLAVVVRWRRG